MRMELNGRGNSLLRRDEDPLAKLLRPLPRSRSASSLGCYAVGTGFVFVTADLEEIMMSSVTDLM
jgi:hypothetical protein